MFGAQLMRGESIGAPVPPREIDRYPLTVPVDFRRCSVQTLKRYCAKYDLDCVSSMQHAELASLVAKHFQKDFALSNEQAVLKSVSEYIFSFSGGNTLDDIKARTGRRLRTRRTRRGAAGVTGANPGSDASEDEAASEPEPQEVLYCICNRPSFGEMIACDNNECQAGEWFHLQCVGLKEGQVPNNWFCPECEKRMAEGGSKRRRTAGKKRLAE